MLLGKRCSLFRLPTSSKRLLLQKIRRWLRLLRSYSAGFGVRAMELETRPIDTGPNKLGACPPAAFLPPAISCCSNHGLTAEIFASATTAFFSRGASHGW